MPAYTPQQLEAIQRQLSDAYQSAEQSIVDRLTSVASGTDWSEAFLDQQRRQVQRQLKTLGRDSSKWVHSHTERMYGRGMAAVDWKLQPGGLSKMAHPGEVTPMDLGMTRLHREAVAVLGENAAMKLDQALTVVGRRVDDQFRSIALLGTQQSFAIGETRKQLSDRLVRDFASKGITSFTDSRGRNWSMGGYAKMVGRTTSREATQVGLINRCLDAQVDVVEIDSHSSPCDLCGPWEGERISLTGATPDLPTLADAVADGYNHPNCEHTELPVPDHKGAVPPMVDQFGLPPPDTCNVRQFMERAQRSCIPRSTCAESLASNERFILSFADKSGQLMYAGEPGAIAQEAAGTHVIKVVGKDGQTYYVGEGLKLVGSQDDAFLYSKNSVYGRIQVLKKRGFTDVKAVRFKPTEIITPPPPPPIEEVKPPPDIEKKVRGFLIQVRDEQGELRFIGEGLKLVDAKEQAYVYSKSAVTGRMSVLRKRGVDVVGKIKHELPAVPRELLVPVGPSGGVEKVVPLPSVYIGDLNPKQAGVAQLKNITSANFEKAVAEMYATPEQQDALIARMRHKGVASMPERQRRLIFENLAWDSRSGTTSIADGWFDRSYGSEAIHVFKQAVADGDELAIRLNQLKVEDGHKACAYWTQVRYDFDIAVRHDMERSIPKLMTERGKKAKLSSLQKIHEKFVADCRKPLAQIEAKGAKALDDAAVKLLESNIGSGKMINLYDALQIREDAKVADWTRAIMRSFDTSKLSATQVKRVQEATRQLSQICGDKVLYRLRDRKIKFITGSGRAFARQFPPTVMIDSRDQADVICHELLHQIEYGFMEDDLRYPGMAYREARRTGLISPMGGGYDAHEVSTPGPWSNRYSGKVYLRKSVTGGEQETGYTEVMSMFADITHQRWSDQPLIDLTSMPLGDRSQAAYVLGVLQHGVM